MHSNALLNRVNFLLPWGIVVTVTATEAHDLAKHRLIQRGDLVPCSLAFIDCKMPGSLLKQNYSIIGAGVTQSADQVVNLEEEHGFALGVAAMPNGVTNNLHVHYTSEVFMIFRGEWRFRWGRDGKDGEFVGRAGDVVSIPTWIFRGFTNIGADDSWIFTALGRDESGGVIWDPAILAGAAEHGLYLTRDNMMIDTATGAAKPDDADLMPPLTEDVMASFRSYSPAEMAARVTTAGERAWSDRALLCSMLPGMRAELAPVIGPGMTQDRNAAPKVTNPHGYSIEWLRIEPGNSVGPFRIDPKQVLILQTGQLEIALEAEGVTSSAVANPWDVFSTPGAVWRTFRSTGTEAAVMTVVTAGDARALPEWAPEIAQAAWEAGYGIDPNDYIAPAAFLPSFCAPDAPDAPAAPVAAVA